MNKLDKILKIVYMLLLGYVCLIPFYYYPPSYFFGVQIPIIKYIPLLLILFLSVKLLYTEHGGIKGLKQETLNLLILFYFFLFLLSGLGTVYYRISILKAVYYGLTGILIYFVIYAWRLRQIDKLFFLRGIVIIGFIVSLYGIATLVIKKDVLFAGLQYSKSNLTEPGIFLEMGRISSSFGNPLFLGGFLSTIFPLALFLHLFNSGQKRIPHYLTAIMPAVIFIATMLTFSVGAFLGVVAFYVFYYVKIKGLYKTSPNYKRAGVLFFSGVVLLCAVLFMITANYLLDLQGKDYFFGGYLGRFDFQKLANAQAVSLRMDSLRCAADFLKTNYRFFGIGIGQIGAGDNQILRVSMDNYYCLSLIESGLPATTLLLIIFYSIIKKAYNKLTDSISMEEKRLVVFLTGSFIIFFINMLFWDVFNHPTMRILFWSFVGFLI
ncbi:O-antigen ligase family protein [Candidatus Omnitrophota bacterium]